MADMEEVEKKMAAALEGAGLSLGTFLSRKLSWTRGGPAHQVGLPLAQAAVLVAPQWSPIDGDHTILVTTTTFQSWVLPNPTLKSRWKPWKEREEIAYTSPAMLTQLVAQLVAPQRGCW